MAKLLIFRGETLHAERELTGQPLRIGRSAQNDIVLEDPSKGVSRDHAELRVEGGRYTLVDRESQNGIWVAGTRVTSVVLEPDIVATVGPYRLRIDAPVALAAAEPEPAEQTHIAEHPAARPLVLDDVAPPPDEADAPSAVVPETPGGDGLERAGRSRAWVVVAAAVLLFALSAVAVYTVMNRDDEPVWNREAVETLVNNGGCQEALTKHIDPELATNPNNAEARALRDRCVSPPPAAEPPPITTSVPVPSVAERLDEADALISANDCQKATDTITAVLGEEPDNERATQMLAKAKACGAPAAAPPPPAEPLAVRVAPSQGGLEPLTKETRKNYNARMDAMRRRYEEGVSQLERQNYQAAAKIFADLTAHVPEGYLELSARREQARSGLREQAKSSVAEAQAAESAGDFDKAVDLYRRAHELDSSLQIDGPLQRINQRKLELGRKRCDEGKAFFSLGNNARAAEAFKQVLRLLPQSEPCYGLAKERLTQIGQ